MLKCLINPFTRTQTPKSTLMLREAKPAAKSSKVYMTEIPDTFLQRGRAKRWMEQEQEEGGREREREGEKQRCVQTDRHKADSERTAPTENRTTIVDITLADKLLVDVSDNFCFCLLGGFQTGGGFHFFREKVHIVLRTLSGLFLVGALNRLRKRKGTNRENPRTIPEQIGKIPEKIRKGPKKDKKGRTSPDRETPPFEPPPFGGP